MKPLRTLSPRPKVIVDQWGYILSDPTDGSVVGIPGPLGGERLVWALPTNTTGGLLSNRYRPPFDSSEECVIGINYDNVIPLGVGIASGELHFYTNTVPAVLSTDFKIEGPLTIIERSIFATISGGVDGTDYQLAWEVTDTNGNVWPRTPLLLCSITS